MGKATAILKSQELHPMTKKLLDREKRLGRTLTGYGTCVFEEYNKCLLRGGTLKVSLQI